MPTRPLIDYILNGLEAAPLVQARLLENCTIWDESPDPSRFTLREMVAHLADWEIIWMERVERFLNEDHPFLPSIDEGEIAIKNNYREQDPGPNLARYAERRKQLLETLRALPDDKWSRTGHRQFVGDLTLFELAALITGHDGYHLKQTITFLSSNHG